MKKNIHTSILALFSFVFSMLFATTSQAQRPDWSVDLPAFEYSMTMAVSLYYNDSTNAFENDLVAAFVGDEVRGFAEVQYISQIDQYIAYLLVKSNVVEGESLSFKMYDSQNDVVIDAVNQLSFRSNEALGTTAEPYFISDTGQPIRLSISSNEVEERLPLRSVVGDLSSLDILGTDHSYRLVSGEGDTHNNLFRIEGERLFTAAILNFANQSQLSIRVESTNELGFSRQQAFTIHVLESDNPQASALTNLSLSNLSIQENNLPNAVVGAFSTEGTFPREQVYTYSLVPGQGSEDNALFIIDGQQLQAATVLDFEEKAAKNIRVLVTSQDGGILERTFNIQMVDVNEAPAIETRSFFVEENSARGTVIGTVAANDPENGNLFYSITNQPGEINTEFPFQIGSASGELTVNNAELLDFEVTTEIVIEVRAEDEEGLFTAANVRIDIEDVIEQFLPVNNIITPNGDGFNDTWEVRSLNSYSNYTLTIYNAAGREVFRTENYQNDWAGTWDGRALPSGAFYYVFQSRTDDSIFKGAISLIR